MFFQPYTTVKKFIDDIYNGLTSNELQLDMTLDLANVFSVFRCPFQPVF
jgi:hypothetical protein